MLHVCVHWYFFFSSFGGVVISVTQIEDVAPKPSLHPFLMLSVDIEDSVKTCIGMFIRQFRSMY